MLALKQKPEWKRKRDKFRVALVKGKRAWTHLGIFFRGKIWAKWSRTQVSGSVQSPWTNRESLDPEPLTANYWANWNPGSVRGMWQHSDFYLLKFKTGVIKTEKANIGAFLLKCLSMAHEKNKSDRLKNKKTVVTVKESEHLEYH